MGKIKNLTTHELNQICLNAIIHFGEENQKVVATEELSELQKEICKDLRGELKMDNLLEELADVYIMLTQVRMMYHIKKEDLQEMISKKGVRLKKRVEGETDEG